MRVYAHVNELQVAPYRLQTLWSATGAVLSVFATLWATLIGQTIPQILASPPSSRARFLRAASHACAHLPAAPGMAVPGPGGQAELPQEVTMKSADAITHIQNDFNERASEPLELTAQDLLTLSAPAQYVTEYRAFEQMFGETAFAFDQMQQTIDRLASLGTGRGTDVYRRDLASVLNAIAGTFGKVTKLSARGSLLQLHECVLGLNGIATQLELLDDAFTIRGGASLTRNQAIYTKNLTVPPGHARTRRHEAGRL